MRHVTGVAEHARAKLARKLSCSQAQNRTLSESRLTEAQPPDSLAAITFGGATGPFCLNVVSSQKHSFVGPEGFLIDSFAAPP